MQGPNQPCPPREPSFHRPQSFWRALHSPVKPTPETGEVRGGAHMRPLMPLRSVSSLIPLGGSTTYPQMGVIGWPHLVTIRDCHPLSMAVGRVRAVTHVTVPSHRPQDGRILFVYLLLLVCSSFFSDGFHVMAQRDNRTAFLPAMIEDISSQDSSLVSEERSLVLRLVLTTFAGEELQLSIDLQEFDRLNEFETAVLENIGECSTFGRELDFVHKDTQEILTDPIWDTLRDNNCFNLIVRQCLAQAEHKGQLKNRVRAIRVPSTIIDRVCHMLFCFFPRVRTSCGRCVQVIIESMETLQVGGGRKPKTPNQNPKAKQPNNKTQPRPPIQCGQCFLCTKVRQVKS